LFTRQRQTMRSPVLARSIPWCDRSLIPSQRQSCSLPFEGRVREGSRQGIGIVDLVLGDPIELNGLELFINAGISPLPESPVLARSMESCDRRFHSGQFSRCCSLPLKGRVREGLNQGIGIVYRVKGDPIELNGLELFIDAGGSPLQGSPLLVWSMESRDRLFYSGQFNGAIACPCLVN